MQYADIHLKGTRTSLKRKKTHTKNPSDIDFVPFLTLISYRNVNKVIIFH